jgi:hypothetical protein
MEGMIKQIQEEVQKRMESVIQGQIEEKTKPLEILLTTYKDDSIRLKAENETIKKSMEAYKASNALFIVENQKLKEKVDTFKKIEAMLATYSAAPAAAAAAAPDAAPARAARLTRDDRNTIVAAKKRDYPMRPMSPHINEPVKTRIKLPRFINFTDDEIREIRRLATLPGADRPTDKKIGEQFGIISNSISGIACRKTYKWVK